MSLTVDNVTFRYTVRDIIKNVSFKARDGELIAVLGPNGVGKTTLFRCLLGLEKVREGRILVDDIDTESLTPREMAGRIAYIPQIRRPVFGYSVLDMVVMGTAQRLPAFAVPGPGEIGDAEEALARMGILDLRDKDYGKISGGEQQLVLIARALAQHSENLIMDEPTSALDYGNQARVLEEVRRLADEGYCVVLTTHNPQQALWYADRTLALKDGQVLACGDPAEILTKPLIETLYGIEVSLIRTGEGPLIAPAVKRKAAAGRAASDKET